MGGIKTLDKKQNCFNLIRIMAAIQVFLGHASTHLEVPLSHTVTMILKCFEGVPIFFVLSGFLIWYSLDKKTNFKVYVKKRIFRLYPELWGGVLCSIVSLLVLYRTNINWEHFVAWIFTQSTMLQFWTPACLRGFGCGTPNGSLWTIGVMVQCYVVIWFFHKLLHKASIKRWGIFLVIGVGINYITPMLRNIFPILIYKLYAQTFLPYIWIFVLGALFCEYFESVISILKKRWYMFFSISAIVAITGFDQGSYGTLKVLFLAPALIGFAYRLTNINIKYDISYGFYIYHMIVINIMIEIHYMGSIYHILLAAIMTTIMALLSYFTIGSLGREMSRKIVY